MGGPTTTPAATCTFCSGWPRTTSPAESRGRDLRGCEPNAIRVVAGPEHEHLADPRIRASTSFTCSRRSAQVTMS